MSGKSPLGTLILSNLILLLSQGLVQGAPLPYEGTWKITVPNQNQELSPWIIKIDKEGKKISIVSGLESFAKSQVSDLKADAQAASFTITNGDTRFQITVLPTQAKDKGLLLGSIQVRDQLLPLWMHRTTLEQLTRANAVQETAGFADLQRALKRVDPIERIQGMKAVAERHSDNPVQFLALQAILGQLIMQKADPKDFTPIVERYRKQAARHGTLFLVGANLDLARNLMSHEPSRQAAVESAREAAKLVQADHPLALQLMAQLLLAQGLHLQGKSEESKPLAKVVRKLAEETIKTAKTDEEKLNTTGQLAGMLLSSEAPSIAEEGLRLARRVISLLRSETALPVKVSAYRLLINGLTAQGKEDEAKAIAPTLERLEQQLDQAYLKENLTFKIERLDKRKGSSERVVLVEMFTGTQVRQALAASLAFTGALQSYSSKEVAFLSYHIPFGDTPPDALINRDSETRREFYKGDLEGVPALFVDGKLTPPLGGAGPRAKESYDLLRERVNKALEVPAQARLRLTVNRLGETLTAKAEVSGLKEPGTRIRLRFALVEERIRLEGGSGVRLHHNVVRGFLGGANGFPLTRKEQTQSASLNLAQHRKVLEDYLTEFSKKHGLQWGEKPLALTSLKVIAFVQDEESKQVLQATQVDVPDR